MYIEINLIIVRRKKIHLEQFNIIQPFVSKNVASNTIFKFLLRTNVSLNVQLLSRKLYCFFKYQNKTFLV